MVSAEDPATLIVLEDERTRRENSLAAALYGEIRGDWYLRGATRTELEEATALPWETVRKRLTRAGYMTSRSR